MVIFSHCCVCCFGSIDSIVSFVPLFLFFKKALEKAKALRSVSGSTMPSAASAIIQGSSKTEESPRSHSKRTSSPRSNKHRASPRDSPRSHKSRGHESPRTPKKGKKTSSSPRDSALPRATSAGKSGRSKSHKSHRKTRSRSQSPPPPASDSPALMRRKRLEEEGRLSSDASSDVTAQDVSGSNASAQSHSRQKVLDELDDVASILADLGV